MTAHGSPLFPGPPSPDVVIGKMPAWLGLTAAAAAALAKVIAQGAKDVAEKTAKLNAAQTAAPTAGPAGAAAVAKATKDLAAATAKAATDTANMMMSSGVSIHACPVIKVLVPDGIGVVIKPSQTVLINKWGACRIGDPIQEVTSLNSIMEGQMDVYIGD